ncbi:hypothetical protein [Brevinema andersonii]|nr:hypothetical protein [Brevinema andersonii]
MKSAQKLSVLVGEILERKGTTYYGIAAAATDIIKAVLYDEQRVMPVSAF